MPQEFAMIPVFRAGAGSVRKGLFVSEASPCPVCLLEGLPQAVLGFVSDRPLPAASTSERISFNRINKKTGTRLKQQLVDAETGQTVDKEDISRGYEIGKGQYLQIEDEEIEKIQIESSHTIMIDTFVPRSEIDDRYIDDPYYIAPTDKVGRLLLWAVSSYRDASMS